MTSQPPSLAATLMQPLYLLADSQLLFARGHDEPFLARVVRQATLTPASIAAYIGASNGDAPEYFEILESAMTPLGVANCRMIRSSFPAEDEVALAGAEIILLAGGDVHRGWDVFCATGMRDLIVQRYHAGATLIGISAGAVQLGLYGARPRRGGSPELFETFQLCPFIVGAHDERQDWRELVDSVRQLAGRAAGVGIRSGAGVVVHQDGRLEAVRHPADEFVWTGGAVARRLLSG
jgi:cyanophycinase-like exopeptidase